MRTASEIIARFGGPSALARLLDKTPSTVAYWARIGVIPAKWQATLLMLAKQQGISLTPEDFIRPADDGAQALNDEPVTQPGVEWRGVLKVGDLELPVSLRLSPVH
jgi:hypothetical protein